MDAETLDVQVACLRRLAADLRREPSLEPQILADQVHDVCVMLDEVRVDLLDAVAREAIEVLSGPYGRHEPRYRART